MVHNAQKQAMFVMPARIQQQNRGCKARRASWHSLALALTDLLAGSRVLAKSPREPLSPVILPPLMRRITGGVAGPASYS